MSKPVNVEDLGRERDRLKIPPPRESVWAEGDQPYGETVDLDEFPVEVLKFTKCRSFHADMRHKLTIILRAAGGYGAEGVRNAAKALRVSRWTFRRWFQWESTPQALRTFERIDNVYEEAIHTLVAEKLKKKK